MIIAAIRKKVWDAPVLSELNVWHDCEERDGPLNMAVDEWLWRTTTVPLLRIYGWSGEWMSIGYFSASSAVSEGRAFVRRPTGGGLVDHRGDWTYTLIIPRGQILAELPGAESYRLVHQALCDVLCAEGLDCHLISGLQEMQSDFCFQQPVRYDLVDELGNKLAGAGQRRGKQGLLHQGSVQAVTDQIPQRGMALATELSASVREIRQEIDEVEIHRLQNDVYRQSSWNFRR